MEKEGPPITMQPLAASSCSTDYQTDYGTPLMSGPPITMQPLAASSYSTDYQTDYGTPLMPGDGSAQVTPGLECLRLLDRVIMKGEASCKLYCNCNCGCEVDFVIRDVKKKELLTVNTPLNCTCGPGADMEMTDESGNVVMQYTRPQESLWSKFIDIYAPAGVKAGRITQNRGVMTCCSCCVDFTIVDDKGITRFTIENPPCQWHHMKFPIKNEEGEEIGKIEQSWQDPEKGFTNYFTVSFPPEMDVKMKGVLIGAAFLMYNLYFEQFIDESCYEY